MTVGFFNYYNLCLLHVSIKFADGNMGKTKQNPKLRQPPNKKLDGMKTDLPAPRPKVVLLLLSNY